MPELTEMTEMTEIEKMAEMIKMTEMTEIDGARNVNNTQIPGKDLDGHFLLPMHL